MGEHEIMPSAIQILPYAVAVLEIAAGAVYVYHYEWRLAFVWLCIGAANAAFAGIK